MTLNFLQWELVLTMDSTCKQFTPWLNQGVSSSLKRSAAALFFYLPLPIWGVCSNGTEIPATQPIIYHNSSNLSQKISA